MPVPAAAAGQAVLLVAVIGQAAVRIRVAIVGRDQRVGLVEDLLLLTGRAAVGRDFD
jgi:hypothetical protein